MRKHRLKQDKYRRARGGYARFFKIACGKCTSFLALYQKDGPGPLKRMYLDRIFAPPRLAALKNNSFKKLPALTCSKCKQVIGIPFIYQKEKRLSFRLFEGSVKKSITQAV